MPEEKRTIGYICPVCGKAVIVERTAFQLAAADNHLACPCGKSELTIRQRGDHCEVTVPCVYCAKDHQVVCSNDALLHQKLLALTCSASGLGCCYVGEEDAVFAAMRRPLSRLRRNLTTSLCSPLQMPATRTPSWTPPARWAQPEGRSCTGKARATPNRRSFSACPSRRKRS